MQLVGDRRPPVEFLVLLVPDLLDEQRYALKNTRTAYMYAIGRMFAWCEHHQIGGLAGIEPLYVAAYIEALGTNFEEPTASSTWLPSVSCSTGSLPARSSPPSRRTRSAGRSMS